MSELPFASKFGDQDNETPNNIEETSNGEIIEETNEEQPQEEEKELQTWDTDEFNNSLNDIYKKLDIILLGDLDKLSLKYVLNELSDDFNVEFDTFQKQLLRQEIKERLLKLSSSNQNEEEEQQQQEEEDHNRKKKHRRDKKDKKDKRSKRKHEESQSEHDVSSAPENDEDDYEETTNKSSKKKGVFHQISQVYPDWPKKPMSAFFIYSNQMRDTIKAENPDIKFTEITALLGTKWNELPEEEKLTYKEQYDADKLRYETELNVFNELHPEAKQWIANLSKKTKPTKDSSQVITIKKRKVNNVEETADQSDGGSEVDADDEEGGGKKGRAKNVQHTYVDEVLSRMKRPPKKDVDEQDKVDIVRYFIARLTDAAKKDMEHNKNKEPAIEKLKLLPEFLDKSQKLEWQEYLMDEGILKVIRDWLKPLPDGSLPNQKIRSELFKTLNFLPVTQDYLEESGGLGKVLTFLAKHPLESDANRKFLEIMITKWCRPIFDASTDYKNLANYESERIEDIKNRKRLIAQNDTELKDFQNSTRARIPSRAAFDYAIRPTGIVSTEKDGKVSSNKPTSSSLMDRVSKKMELKGKVKLQQALSVSVTKLRASAK